MCWFRSVVPILLVGCISPPTTVSLNQEFVLAPGQTVRIAETGYALTFERVAEDSRCPADVTCVWEGNAEVRVQMRTADGDSLLKLNTAVEPRAATLSGLRLELRAVEPLPRAGVPVADSSYRVRLYATGGER